MIGYNRTSGSYIPLSIGGNTNQTTTIGGSSIVFQNNGVTALTLASTGAATFDTSAAVSAIFNSTNASGGYLSFRRSGTNIGYLGNSAQLGIGVLNALELRADNNLFLTTTSGTLSILSNGKVGIGTSTPDNSYQGLTISGTDPSLRLKTTSGSGWVWTEYVTSAGVNNFSMGVNQTIPYFGIKAGAGLDNPNFAIVSSGNVLIGTTTDTGGKLQLGGFSGAVNQNNGIKLTNNVGTIVGLEIGGSNDSYIGTISASNFSIRTANTPIITAASSGNVGIGTSSPSTILQANFSNSNAYSSGVTGNGLMLYNTSTTNNQYVGLYFLGEPAAGNAGQATIYGITTGSGAMDLAFSTRGSSILSERMRITSGGEVLVGTQTTDVNTQGCQLRPFGLGIFVRSGASTLQLNRLTSDGIIASFRTSDVERGSISISGSTTSYNTTSDYRLKEDFKEVKGLEKVGAIKVYDYKWKLDEKRMDGVLAHELAEVLPYAVFGEKDEVDENGNDQMQSVDYSKIVPILIKAIQELQAKLDKNNIN